MESLKDALARVFGRRSSSCEKAVVAETSQKGLHGVRWSVSLCIVMYGMIFNGAVYGYTSPALPMLLGRTDSGGDDFRISKEEASWMASVTSLGFPAGSIACGFLVHRLGKKWTAVFGQALTYVVGHLLIMKADTALYLYAGRAVCGICQGFCNCLTILYVLSVCHGSSAKTKSLAGVTLCLLGNASTLLTYVMGEKMGLNWRELAGALSALAIPYVVGVVFVVPADKDLPDALCAETSSPPAEKGDSCKTVVVTIEDCRGSTKSSAIDENLGEYQVRRAFAESAEDRSFPAKVKEALVSAPLWTGIFMMLFYQFGGYNVVTFYASTIIYSAASSMSDGDMSGDATLVVGVAGIAGVLLGVILVNCGIGRKRILLLSAIGTAVAFVAVGFSFAEGVSVYVPTATLTFHILLFNLGYGPLVYPAIAELMPLTVRSQYLAIVTTFGGIFGFANAKSFDNMNASVGSSWTFWIYGIINVCGAVYVAVCLPSLP